MKRMFYLLVTVILIAGVNVTAQQENSEQKSPKVQSLSISPKFSIAPKTLSTPYYNFVFSNVRWIGDINGDGKTEIAKSMYTGDERTESDISDLCWKTAFFSSSPVNEPSHIYYDRNFLGIGDFNNDGIDDVFDVVTSSVFIGSNTGLNPVGAQMTNFRGTENIIPLNDVNGDGFADFFSFNNDSCQYALGNNEPFREFIRLPDYNALGSIKVYPFDFDKDGEAELFIMPDASETVTMCYILKYENDDFILADSVDFAIHFNISLSGFCDINGDKLPDFWYPVQDASTKLYDLEVRFGISAAPYFSTDKKLIKTQASTNKFIYSGDINQDGYDDVVATDLKVPPTIFLGKADVINGFTVRAINVPPFIITWPTEQSILGDENGDSYPDMMYNYYQLDLNTGRVINIGFGILQGGEIISEANNRALSQDFEEAGMTLRYGMISDNLGDVNGDGYEDFGITSFDNIYADVFFGGKNINTAADTKIELSQHTGAILYSIDGGDINGDGLSDIIVSNIEPDFKSKVFIYYGRQNWEPVLYETDADVAIESPAGMLYFGYFIQVIGDYNDDGYNDFVVSGMNYPVNDTTYKMESYLYLGGATINTTPITLSFGESKTIQYFGYRISKLGDVNDDGYDDFALSDRNFAEGS
ncbi:MAG: hypothetical protein QG635_2261, partial [Bacteroidota bacterium]|nr:hypothetical protein [Bacteroidota bacterium]